MQWFREVAPIRLNLLITFAIMTGLTALAALAPLLASPGVALAISGGATLATILAGIVIRGAIADPYVATVVRMEGLAAGNLVAPIEFTGYQDCVGRMTKAMLTFRETAQAQILDIEKAEHSAGAVQAMTANIQSLAEGDLTAEITVNCPPELAELKVSFNKALENLRNFIAGVTESAHGLRAGSHEIAQASEDLARRTESNAASLEETSAALVQIETRLRATATSSKGTVARADQAIAAVGTGRATAEGAMAAMTRVSSSAKGIDSVIEGVDKIAFQTRVLAMNAAVEAGRAGDAGRGFAVVADLVSALAMRAEEEAKRARDQLTVTQAEIVIAVDAVQKVDGALSDISGDVDAVHKLLANMAEDNLAQSAAVTEITSAVGSMDKATQQNAAMVEETSAAARNLTTEVETLAEQTGQFRTESSNGYRPARRAAPAQPVRMAQKASKPALRAIPKASLKAAANGHANGHAVTGNDWADF